jgi:polyphosphate kinase
MQRNLDRRVESTFPILDSDIKQNIINNILKTYLKDNQKARILSHDGKYTRVKPGQNEADFSVQDFFMKY